ncbi:uncharacterized protein LOC106876123 [Octopus bimaculoides]|uniref:uncharacterized protein LOC106876123 n=1 Tax=Octopus bimaculoides TaxID=37653 RepID=UPI00071D1118|nr:uncharacterized protein LOC106876123 [Octopus bimaculoides]|eukprot:XP_014780018.1 PREDICTED: uncharacterized protein LOC106876123 [Octopus bimaculoides]
MFQPCQIEVTKTDQQKITELQYADDKAPGCHSSKQLQQSVNNFTNAYTQFSLKVNIKKTKILAQPILSQETPDLNIIISEMPLEKVDHFSYLGSLLSNKCTLEKDMENRLRVAYTIFGGFAKRVIKNKDLNHQTKLSVYQAVVISTLLYGFETCTLYRSDIKKN